MLQERIDEFSAGKYGVMEHFLGSAAAGIDAWNKRVDAFDCIGLAEQLHEVGASHFIFTLMQNGGLFPAPCPEYERILSENGYHGGGCSQRDLVAELYDALSVYGIKLILYLSAEGPTDGTLGGIFPWDDSEPGELFCRRWFSVLKAFSVRYGKKVFGWWIDGCYKQAAVFRDPLHPFTRDMIASLKAGNPDAIVTLSNGSKKELVSEYQDYITGQTNTLDDFPSDRYFCGRQWHSLIYLGPYWASAGVFRSNAEIIRYVRKCSSVGGVVTMEAACDAYGHIVAEHYDQLSVVKTFLREKENVGERDIPESEAYMRFREMLEFDRIPDDYVNIAYGKKCYATSYYDVPPFAYPPEAAIDGQSMTGWAPSAGDSDGMTWTLDLGDCYCLSAVQYTPRKQFAFERRDFEIIASLMPDFSAYTTLLRQGDFPLPAGVIPARVLSAPVLARYVRLRPTRTNVRPFIQDIKIFIKPDKKI